METVKIKLGQLFEVDGKIYVIVNPPTPSSQSNLENGQNIYSLIGIN